MEAGGKNHLDYVLSEAEIANLPNGVADKINSYIDTKFEQYLTSKALFESTKSQIGVAQQSVSGSRRGGETPLASIRPMAQVGPTAPHDAHTTEYMPASSSRPLTRSSLAASTSPPESTQAVALVLPRIEQPSGGGTSSLSGVAGSPAPAPAPAQPPPSAPLPASAVSGAVATGQASSVSTSHATAADSTSHAATVGTSHSAPVVTTSHSAPGVSTSHSGAGVSTSHVAPGVSTSHAPPGVSTSHPPPDARPMKRRLQSRPVTSKRTRVQEEQEVEGGEEEEEVEGDEGNSTSRPGEVIAAISGSTSGQQ